MTLDGDTLSITWIYTTVYCISAAATVTILKHYESWCTELLQWTHNKTKLSKLNNKINKKGFVDGQHFRAKVTSRAFFALNMNILIKYLLNFYTALLICYTRLQCFGNFSQVITEVCKCSKHWSRDWLSSSNQRWRVVSHLEITECWTALFCPQLDT